MSFTSIVSNYSKGISEKKSKGEGIFNAKKFVADLGLDITTEVKEVKTKTLKLEGNTNTERSNLITKAIAASTLIFKGTDIKLFESSKEMKDIIDSSSNIKQLESKLINRINAKIRNFGSNSIITSLTNGVPVTEQLAMSFYNNSKDIILSKIDEYVKNVCSQDKSVLVKNVFIRCIDMMLKLDKENTIKEYSLKEESVNSIDNILEEVKDAISELNKSSLEDLRLIYNLSDEDFVKLFGELIKYADSENKKKASTTEEVVDVEFSEVKEEVKAEVKEEIKEDPKVKQNIEKIKDEARNKIEYFKNRAYNKSIIGVMLSSNNNETNRSKAIAIRDTYIDQMEELVKNVDAKTTIIELKKKFETLQSEMVHKINDLGGGRVMSSNGVFVSSVSEDGTALEAIDAFGDVIIQEPTMFVPNDSVSNNYVELFKKYPILGKLNTQVCSLGVDVSLTFKEIKGIFEVTLYAQERPVTIFYIDMQGLILTEHSKVILPCNSTLEDGYMFDINNIQLLLKYLTSNATDEDLMKVDLAGAELRELNKIVDLSSIPSTCRKAIVKTIKNCDELLTEAVKVDFNARFTLDNYTDDNNFELHSNSKVKKSFLDNKARRKNQIITIVNGVGKLELIEK